MHAMPTWNLDATSILTRRELAAVLADLKVRRSMNARRNLVVLRLACCCGLRVSVIAQLLLDDVVLDSPRPHLALRATTTKGKRARRVPLWWDSGTLSIRPAWRGNRIGKDGALKDRLRLHGSLHEGGNGVGPCSSRIFFPFSP